MAISALDLSVVTLAATENLQPTPVFDNGKPVYEAGKPVPKTDAAGNFDYRVNVGVPSDSPQRAFDNISIHVAATENPVAAFQPHDRVKVVNPVISFGSLSGGGQYWRIDAAGFEAAK